MNRVVLVLRAARQLDLFAGGAVQLQLEVGIRKRLRRDDRMLTAGRRLFPFLFEEERRSRHPYRARPTPTVRISGPGLAIDTSLGRPLKLTLSFTRLYPGRARLGA